MSYSLSLTDIMAQSYSENFQLKIRLHPFGVLWLAVQNSPANQSARNHCSVIYAGNFHYRISSTTPFCPSFSPSLCLSLSVALDNTFHAISLHNSHDKFGRQIIVSNQTNQIESWLKHRCCAWVWKRAWHLRGLNSRPRAWRTNVQSRVWRPLGYPGAPNIVTNLLRSIESCPRQFSIQYNASVVIRTIAGTAFTRLATV